ncbi:MAG TPA: L-aspartate oxidase [Dehalococcoidia bacterium]|nr:L-aspartate oxidase [Dehalococcoidia bacterium]
MKNGRVVIYEHTLAVEIVMVEGQTVGIRALEQQSGIEHFFEASAVILATGGAGAAFSHTTNTPVATGDGISLAFAAGAEVTDLEFYQFHPTAFRQEGAPPFLISEALRGEGAVLRNHRGQAFMGRYHELADLAPRDIVARAMISEMRASNSDHIWLDCTVLNNLNPIERFPGIASFCRERGIDLRKDHIPVAPAAHYLMGGVRTDNWGRTTVPGLYACGESAATGVHGANRLASNSLLETVVFAKRAVEHIESNTGGAMPPSSDSIPFLPAGGAPVDISTIQRLLWKHAGIERTGQELRAGLAVVRAWPMNPRVVSRENHELAWLSIFAELLLTAALIREESRGAHFRTDFPQRDDERWGRHLVFHRAD